jgi:hypothetical protein
MESLLILMSFCQIQLVARTTASPGSLRFIAQCRLCPWPSLRCIHLGHDIVFVEVGSEADGKAAFEEVVDLGASGRMKESRCEMCIED